MLQAWIIINIYLSEKTIMEVQNEKIDAIMNKRNSKALNRMKSELSGLPDVNQEDSDLIFSNVYISPKEIEFVEREIAIGGEEEEEIDEEEEEEEVEDEEDRPLREHPMEAISVYIPQINFNVLINALLDGLKITGEKRNKIFAFAKEAFNKYQGRTNWDTFFVPFYIASLLMLNGPASDVVTNQELHDENESGRRSVANFWNTIEKDDVSMPIDDRIITAGILKKLNNIRFSLPEFESAEIELVEFTDQNLTYELAGSDGDRLLFAETTRALNLHGAPDNFSQNAISFFEHYGFAGIHSTHELPYSLTRFNNVFGPYQRFAKLIMTAEDHVTRIENVEAYNKLSLKFFNGQLTAARNVFAGQCIGFIDSGPFRSEEGMSSGVIDGATMSALIAGKRRPLIWYYPDELPRNGPFYTFSKSPEDPIIELGPDEHGYKDSFVFARDDGKITNYHTRLETNCEVHILRYGRYRVSSNGTVSRRSNFSAFLVAKRTINEYEEIKATFRNTFFSSFPGQSSIILPERVGWFDLNLLSMQKEAASLSPERKKVKTVPRIVPTSRRPPKQKLLPTQVESRPNIFLAQHVAEPKHDLNLELDEVNQSIERDINSLRNPNLSKEDITTINEILAENFSKQERLKQEIFELERAGRATAKFVSDDVSS